MQVYKEHAYTPHAGRTRHTNGKFKSEGTTVEKLIRDGEMMIKNAKIVIKINCTGAISVEHIPFALANFLVILKEVTVGITTFYAVAIEIGLGRSVPYEPFELKTKNKNSTSRKRFTDRKRGVTLSEKEILHVWPVVVLELKAYVDGLAQAPRKGKLEWSLSRNVTVRHPFFITIASEDIFLQAGFNALSEHYRKVRLFQVLALRLLQNLEWERGTKHQMEVLSEAVYTPESLMKIIAPQEWFLPQAKRIILDFVDSHRKAPVEKSIFLFERNTQKLLKAAIPIGLETTQSHRKKKKKATTNSRHRKGCLLVGLYPSEDALQAHSIRRARLLSLDAADPDATIPF